DINNSGQRFDSTRTYITLGKCANGQSVSALFFAVIVNGVTDLKEAENSRSWSIHPVFRCRRCD
ncbi:Hypothetical predicted protein, partial [Drosophila guanche]